MSQLPQISNCLAKVTKKVCSTNSSINYHFREKNVESWRTVSSYFRNTKTSHWQYHVSIIATNNHSCREFYGIRQDFPVSQLFVRSNKTPPEQIYFVSNGIKQLIDEEKNMKVRTQFDRAHHPGHQYGCEGVCPPQSPFIIPGLTEWSQVASALPHKESDSNNWGRSHHPSGTEKSLFWFILGQHQKWTPKPK